MMPPDNPVSWAVLFALTVFFIIRLIVREVREERKRHPPEPKIEYDQDLVFFD